MQSFFCLGGGTLFFIFLETLKERAAVRRRGRQWWRRVKRRQKNKWYARKEGKTGRGIRCILWSLPPLLLLLFAFFRARMTCNYVWACPKSEVTQITPSFSRAVEMRERKEPTPPPPPVLPHPPNPRRHHIKYHEIISVISMEICLQIINTLLPPSLSYPLSVQNLSLWAVFPPLYPIQSH